MMTYKKKPPTTEQLIEKLRNTSLYGKQETLDQPDDIFSYCVLKIVVPLRKINPSISWTELQPSPSSQLELHCTYCFKRLKTWDSLTTIYLEHIIATARHHQTQKHTP